MSFGGRRFSKRHSEHTPITQQIHQGTREEVCKRNGLICSPSGERGCSLHTHQLVYLKQPVIKPRHSLRPFKYQDKTGCFPGVQVGSGLSGVSFATLKQEST